jgi:membrane protein required for colicin V production
MIVDIIVLAVLLISALIAFMRGLIREVLTIAGVIGGLAAAYFGGPLLKPHMRDWFGVVEGEEPERLMGFLPYDIVADALSYGVIFIAVVIILSIISHFLAEGVRNIGLGAVDRTLGFIFGLLRGIIILGLLYLPVHLFIDDETKEGMFEGSTTQFYLERTAEMIAEWLPEDAIEKAEDGIEEIEGISETRKKLEEIELLKSDEDEPPHSEPAGEDNVEKNEGYNDEFRDNMDQLFQDETESLNP